MEPERKLAEQGNPNTMSEEQLKELRKFLFEERIRVLNETKSMEEMYEKFMAERLSFREEMRELNSKILFEKKRLKDEQLFFDKKMAILQNGFASLEMDRKAFEREKASYYSSNSSNKSKANETSNYEDVGMLFAGVKSYLGLRKRYRDLMKIYHPDNMDGDDTIVLLIKEEYERIKERF